MSKNAWNEWTSEERRPKIVGYTSEWGCIIEWEYKKVEESPEQILWEEIEAEIAELLSSEEIIEIYGYNKENMRIFFRSIKDKINKTITLPKSDLEEGMKEYDIFPYLKNLEMNSTLLWLENI